MTTNSKQSGFSLLEVLIALVILAIGILGIASLQAKTLRGSSSSHQRSQAVLVAYDMMDRMRSNRTAALAGGYNILLTADTPTGDNVAPLVDDDLAEWFATHVSLVTSGDASINCTNAGICTVVIQWDDSRADATQAAQQFIFTSEI